MKSWLDYEDRFRRLSQPLQYLRLDFQWGHSGEYWRLCGMEFNANVRQFEGLLELAGRALEECSKTYSELERIISLEDSYKHKWYRALKELSGEFKFEFFGEVQDDHGETVGTVYSSGLSNITEASANLCLNFHARFPLKERENFEGTGINISNSAIGLLNTGEIEDVESISVNISKPEQQGEEAVARALRSLAESIENNESLQPETRATVLDQLEELSTQAALPVEERSKAGVLKAIVNGIASTLSAAGGLAEVWTTWGPVIQRFFGF